MKTSEREPGVAGSAQVVQLRPPRPRTSAAPGPARSPAPIPAPSPARSPAPVPAPSPARSPAPSPAPIPAAAKKTPFPARPAPPPEFDPEEPAARRRTLGQLLLDRALAHEAVPDPLLRVASRGAAWGLQRRASRGGVVGQEERLRALLRRMSTGPIAERPERPERPGEEHYELAPELLGPRRMRSACLWEPNTESLAQAEEAMLRLSCERAQIADGMRILDLGCGWGSLSLWLAEQHQGSFITAVGSSHRQRDWIEAERDRRALSNLEVIIADIDDFKPTVRFDRVMSIETFEHMRNWRELLRRISAWLAQDGKVFVHLASHRTLPYLLEGTRAADRFFRPGLIPSHDLLARFQQHLRVADRWVEPGAHYAKTLQAWLSQLDAHAEEALELLIAAGRTRSDARILLGGWRQFLLSTDEIWRYRAGEHWLVSHYLLEPHAR